MEIILRASQKTDAMTVPADGPMFNPCLLINAKNRLYCFETSLNSRLNHLRDVVFVPLPNKKFTTGAVLRPYWQVREQCCHMSGMITMFCTGLPVLVPYWLSVLAFGTGAVLAYVGHDNEFLKML